jgi:hypothetical protein
MTSLKDTRTKIEVVYDITVSNIETCEPNFEKLVDKEEFEKWLQMQASEFGSGEHVKKYPLNDAYNNFIKVTFWVEAN